MHDSATSPADLGREPHRPDRRDRAHPHVIGLIHTLGHRQSSGLQIAATAVTAAVLLSIAVGGMLFGTATGTTFGRRVADASQWPVLAVGLIYVCYAYAGWNGAATSRARSATRPHSAAVPDWRHATVMVLYLLVNLAYVYALDPAAMTEQFGGRSASQSRNWRRTHCSARRPPVLVAGALGLCLIAAVSAYLLTGPRVAYAMARDGMFPAFAGRLHPTRRRRRCRHDADPRRGGAGVGRVVPRVARLRVGRAGRAHRADGRERLPAAPPRGPASAVPAPALPAAAAVFLVLTAWTVGYTVHKEIAVDGRLPGPAPEPRDAPRRHSPSRC